MSENKYTRLAKDTAVFAAGNLLTKLIYFFMVPLYTSAMTTAQYGRAEMLNTLVDIVYPIATMYVVDAMYRFTIVTMQTCSRPMASPCASPCGPSSL